jgi:hypothetical protein
MMNCLVFIARLWRVYIGRPFRRWGIRVVISGTLAIYVLFWSYFGLHRFFIFFLGFELGFCGLEYGVSMSNSPG